MLEEKSLCDRRLFAWKMHGTDDVKILKATDEEQAVRIAIQVRIKYCSQTEEEALREVCELDDIYPIDEMSLFTEEEPGPWKGQPERRVGVYVHRV